MGDLGQMNLQDQNLQPVANPSWKQVDLLPSCHSGEFCSVPFTAVSCNLAKHTANGNGCINIVHVFCPFQQLLHVKLDL